MATNAIKCKYRVKYGWFLFGKYRCEMSLQGKKWTASKAVCNACDGPMLETVHSCTYFKIGTDKPYNDRNTVVVKGYCFRIYKDEKDFRNEIKDLGTCRRDNPECSPYYKTRPIIDRGLPPLIFQPLLNRLKSGTLNVANSFKQFFANQKRLAIFVVVIVAFISYVYYISHNKKNPLETTQESSPSLPSNKPIVAKDHKDGEEAKRKTSFKKSDKTPKTKPDGKHPQDSISVSKKEETSSKQDMIRAAHEAGSGSYSNGDNKEDKALEIDPDNKEAQNAARHIEEQMQKLSGKDVEPSKIVKTGIKPVTEAKTPTLTPQPQPAQSPPELLPERAGASTVVPSDLYNQSYKDYMRGNYDLSITGFSNYLRQFPAGNMAPNALYGIGECYYSKGDYTKAVSAFESVTIDFPKSNKVVSALLKMGYSFEKSSDREKAATYFKNVIEQFPYSDEAKVAKVKLSELNGIKKTNEKSPVQDKNITESGVAMGLHSNKEDQVGSVSVIDHAKDINPDTSILPVKHQGELATDLVQGKRIFWANCIVCHGEKGNGKGPVSAALNPKPTDFTNPAIMKSIDDARLRISIKEGRPGTAMVGFWKTLNDKDIENVIGYIKVFWNQ